MAGAAKKIVNPFADELLDEAEVEAAETGETTEETVEAAEEAPEAKVEEPERKVSEAIPYERFKEINDALKAERDRAKQLEAREKELSEFKIRTEERLKLIDDARRQAEAGAKAAERPDPNIDPVGAELFDLKQARLQDQQRLQQMEAYLQQTGQAMQGQQVQSQMNNFVQADVTRFQQQHPDYIQAANYAATKRAEAWQLAGFTPDQARDIVGKETEALVMGCMQNGKSIAEAVWGLASQWGYQGAAPVNGSATPTPNSQRLAQVAAGQKVQGLNRIPNGATENTGPIENLSAMDIANMSEAEWARMASNPQTLRKFAIAIAKQEGITPEEAMGVLRAR